MLVRVRKNPEKDEIGDEVILKNRECLFVQSGQICADERANMQSIRIISAMAIEKFDSVFGRVALYFSRKLSGAPYVGKGCTFHPRKVEFCLYCGEITLLVPNKK